MRKLDTLVADFPDIYKLTEQDKASKTYSFSKSQISYRKPRKLNMEQRKQAQERMNTKICLMERKFYYKESRAKLVNFMIFILHQVEQKHIIIQKMWKKKVEYNFNLW